MNLFHIAIRHNNWSLFDEQLQPYRSNKGSREDINGFESHTQFTPFQLAVFLGRFGMAIELLIHGANPNHRKNPSDRHILLQIVQDRPFLGELFQNLIFMAVGTDAWFKNVVRGQITFNPVVFHILFFKALMNDKDEYALKLLKETLPSLEKELASTIKESLTGALYFCVKHDKKTIATCLVETGVKLIDPDLPNPGVSLIPWLPEAKAEIIIPSSLSKSLEQLNYIDIAKTLEDSKEPLPITATHLPWQLLQKKQDFYQRVNEFIKTSDWKSLDATIAAGYSLEIHLYAMIADKNRVFHLLDHLKNYSKFNKEQVELLFLYVICDFFHVNELVLSMLLPKNNSGALKDKLSELEGKLKALGACPLALEKFTVVKADLLREKTISTSNSKLAELPATILWQITTYLTKKEIYWEFACSFNYVGKLAKEDRLAQAPGWLRYHNIDDRIHQFTNAIQQISSFNKISLTNYCCGLGQERNGIRQNCNAFPTTICLSGSCVVDTSFALLDACASCDHTYHAEFGLSSFLWGTIGLPLSCLYTGILGCRYYMCDSNLPGRSIDEMTPAQHDLFRAGIRLLSPGTPSPTNTKDLILMLNQEVSRLKQATILSQAEERIRQGKIKRKIKAEEDQPVESKSNLGLTPSHISIWDDEVFIETKDSTELVQPLLSVNVSRD